MLINLTIGCELDRNSGCSECGLILAALSNTREIIELDANRANRGAILNHIDSISWLINDAMLKALESLEPLVIPDVTNDYKTVYGIRTTSEGGRAE